MESPAPSGQTVARATAGASRTDLLLETAKLLQAAMDQAQCAIVQTIAAHGLTELQARVLRFLNLGGPTSMRELADYLGSDPASVTALVDRLEQRDLIERKSDPSDRRVRRLALTAQGETTCGDVRQEFADAFPAHTLSLAQLRDLRALLVAMVGEGPLQVCPRS